ncbi:MAG: AraC family transcriptional regulator [Cytophagales bacterium]|nr:MAG: AraC family transcriptional regulator [Cytophagales bacterium]
MILTDWICMKALLEKLAPTADSSFKLYEFRYPYYPTPWHFHPEYELVLITKSYGQRIVGNHVGDFTEGDLVLIGPNLPHVYRNAPEYLEPNSTLLAESIVVHFLPDFLGVNFWNSIEMAPVRTILHRSAVGLQITGAVRERVVAVLVALSSVKGMRRLLALLDLLMQLAEAPESELVPLSTEPIEGSNPGEDEKLNRVLTYIAQHYQQPITLTELADLLSMSIPSVCRFFKKRTRKSIVQFTNEVRVSHACRLLLDSSRGIAQVAYESGFNNISNFNRQFREIKSMSPQGFRKVVGK